ncbi:MAG: hypothetical protein IKT27_06855 [Clostridia bacterium]|nr:hypothetical protein [Clostridia bacterium]MBR4998503.1 hypothetical protein [Clostridia bacterium]
MANNKMDLSINNLITCAVYAIIGLLLVILQGGSLGILMTVVGVLLIVLGVVDIVKNRDFTKGLIEAIIGVAIIVCGWLIADIVLLILGVLLIVMGVLDLIKNIKGGLMAMLSPIITIVIGVLLVIAKWALLDVFCIIAGVIFLINAVLVLFGKSIVK